MKTAQTVGGYISQPRKELCHHHKKTSQVYYCEYLVPESSELGSIQVLIKYIAPPSLQPSKFSKSNCQTDFEMISDETALKTLKTTGLTSEK